jgi:hypothetical protein
MEIKITTTQILKVLKVLSWIIFIGLCIEAGGIIFNTFIALAINPFASENFWEGAEYLSNLHKLDQGHFIFITFTMIIVAVLKAIMFYLILRQLMDKNINIAQPFSLKLKRFILNLSYVVLGVGIFSNIGAKYSYWLSKQGFQTADLQVLHIEGADIWIFMAIILFAIAQIFQKGIELQTENELTI